MVYFQELENPNDGCENEFENTKKLQEKKSHFLELATQLIQKKEFDEDIEPVLSLDKHLGLDYAEYSSIMNKLKKLEK